MGKKAGRRKPGIGPRLALGIVTAINLGLTLALAAQRWKAVVRVIQEGEVIKLMQEGRTKTF